MCVSAAFICHHNSFLIYGSLERPTLANWSRITHVSVGSALVISAAFAVAGYTTFTGYTQGSGIRKQQTNTPLQSFLFINVNVWLRSCISISFFLGDVFQNYCRNDNLATFGRFCFGLSIITTFPLECFVAREVSNPFSYSDLRIYQLNVYMRSGQRHSEGLTQTNEGKARHFAPHRFSTAARWATACQLRPQCLLVKDKREH